MADALRHAACELLRDDKVPHGLHECLSKPQIGKEFFLPFFHPVASACLMEQLSKLVQPFPSWQVHLPDAGTPPTYDRHLLVAGAVPGLASLAWLSLSENGLRWQPVRGRWVESLRGSEEGPEPSTNSERNL